MTLSEPHANGDVPFTNGYHTGSHQKHFSKDSFKQDEFQHLPKLQQEVLLLHGPRQRYSLETNGELPEIRAEREILVQVDLPTFKECRRLRHAGVSCGPQPDRLEGPVSTPPTRSFEEPADAAL